MSEPRPDRDGQLGPPSAPAVAPRVRMHREELIGMVALALLPLLALLGLFGPGDGEARAAGDVLALEVTYPERVRRGMPATLEARVTNRSAATLPTVALDPGGAFADAFTSVQVTPPPAGTYDVVLRDVRPGETRRVIVALTAHEAGRHEGTVVATPGDAAGEPAGAPVRVPIHSRVFP